MTKSWQGHKVDPQVEALQELIRLGTIGLRNLSDAEDILQRLWDTAYDKGVREGFKRHHVPRRRVAPPESP
jgi:hypothetical protein